MFVDHFVIHSYNSINLRKKSVVNIGKKNVSMKDIASNLDVSIVSVSKAINNKDGVSDDLRRKILDTAYEMGYIAQKRDSADTILKIAYITPKKFYFETEQFYSQIFYHINEKCVQENKMLSFIIVNPEDERRLLMPPIISGDHFDGIFIGGEMSDQYIYSLSDLDIPAVCIDFYKPDMKMDCVIIDNFYAGYNAATYLIRKGHGRIGFVGHSVQTTSILDRFFGYRKALYQYDIEFKNEWHLIHMDDMILPTELPTAFVCHNDETAVAFIKQLNDHGFDVPGDISIISFDNLDISKKSEPPLTTVDINRERFAEKAFSQLGNRMNDRKQPYQRVTLDICLIERSSTRDFKK